MEKPSPIVGHRVDKSALISLEKGKIPPQAVDLEEVVLGAMMIDKKGVDEVIDILHPDVFYKDSHKYIYEAIFKLFESSEPVDLLTVSSQLKKDGKLEVSGGDFYLIKQFKILFFTIFSYLDSRFIIFFIKFDFFSKIIDVIIRNYFIRIKKTPHFYFFVYKN